MSDMPGKLDFDYRISFEKIETSYRIIHYNSPWDSDKDLEDIRIMFDGKDLQDNDLIQYKVVKWEDLKPSKYNVVVQMTLYKSKNGMYEQLFILRSLDKVESGDVV